MANWKYEGLDRNGKRTQGTIDASSEKEVRKILRAQGVRLRNISPPSFLEFDITEWMVEKGFAQAFGYKELALFTKQLAIMINAGVPIIQSLEILYKSEKNASLKKGIKNIARDVGEGKTIGESMEKVNGFDKLYCNLVKAGEAGGILDNILEKLNVHMEKATKTKAQIKSAMTYPTIVVFVGIVVVWGMLVFVVPQFVEMLADTGQKPPFITQLVIDTSDALSKYTPIGLPVCIVILVLLNGYKKTPTGKLLFDNIAMRLPIFGIIVIKGNLEGFSRTLSTMLGSGVSLVDSLDIVIETIDNRVIARDLKMVRAKVVEGKTISEPLSKITYFPEMVTQMIRVGEQTGGVDVMLEKVSEVFEDEVNEAVNNMTKMIEPIIIVVLGSIVAVILVAMYLPIFMAAGGA